MREEIGTAAGRVWNVLNDKGELSLAQLKKASGLKTPLLDWAVGWLACEDKLVFFREPRGSVRLSLK